MRVANNLYFLFQYIEQKIRDEGKRSYHQEGPALVRDRIASSKLQENQGKIIGPISFLLKETENHCIVEQLVELSNLKADMARLN